MTIRIVGIVVEADVLLLPRREQHRQALAGSGCANDDAAVVRPVHGPRARACPRRGTADNRAQLLRLVLASRVSRTRRSWRRRRRACVGRASRGGRSQARAPHWGAGLRGRPLAQAPRRLGAARCTAEAQSIGLNANGGVLFQLGGIDPVLLEVARRLLHMRWRLRLDQTEWDAVDQAHHVEARLALRAGFNSISVVTT